MNKENQIKPKKLNTWLNNEEAVLVDVREADEFQREHIPGAINVPLGAIDSAVLEHIDGDKIVMQCNTGVRSSKACLSAKNAIGAERVFNLTNGLTSWKEAGFKTVHEKRFHLPLNRQVKIAAGCLVLTGVLLGYFVNIAYLLLSGFVGLGLIRAGITGWCGMAKLLSLAPWNRVFDKQENG